MKIHGVLFFPIFKSLNKIEQVSKLAIGLALIPVPGLSWKTYIFIRRLKKMSLLIEHLFRYPLSQIYQSYLNVLLSPWL